MKREQLSDEIFELLPNSELKAMALWEDNYETLKSLENMPILDVLTCVYNAESYIENAIKTIVLQSYSNIHLVIVTDPCTDRTIEIIKQMMERFPNITLIENEHHAGSIACFNIGLEYCKSDFIARMDLDDLIHPMRFEKQMNYLLKHSEIAAISSFMRIFNENGPTKDVSYREDFDIQKITLLFFSPLSHAATIFRGEVLRKFEYDVKMKYAEDYDLWLKVMSEYKTAVLPEYLYLYRTHINQSTNEKNKLIAIETWKVIMQRLFTKLRLVPTEDQTDLHVNYNLLRTPIPNKTTFLNWLKWMNTVYKFNSDTRFFEPSKLKEFVFIYTFVDAFDQFKNELTSTELNTVLGSPYCNFSRKKTLYYKIKKTLGLNI
ncbi:MAG TPA: glycosyltransferase [Bacteroidia bacterium]